jgi:hypothetical protein
VRAGQHEDEDGGRSGQQPADDPGRGGRPGPAAPRTPTPALPVPGRQPGHRHRRRRCRRLWPPAGPRSSLRRGHLRDLRSRNRGNRPGRPGHPPGQRGRSRLDDAELGHQTPRAWPLAGLLGQAALDQPAQILGYVTEGCRAVDQPVHQRGARPGAERSVTTTGEDQHGTQAEDVARRPEVIALGLFRRRELRRAEVRQRQPARRGGLPDPEVGQPRPVLRQQHVRRVEVPVHHARGVNGAQAFRQSGRQRRHAPGGHRPVLTDPLGQRRARDVRRRQPRYVAVQIRVDHRDDERPAYLPGRGDLGPELAPEPGIRGQLGQDHPYLYRVPVRRAG